MRSCLKHTPCRWLRETIPPAWKICQHGWVLVCILQSFLCTGAQVPGPEPGGTRLEQGALNGWGIGQHTMPDAVGKDTVLHFPWVWSTAWPSLPETGGREMRKEERRGEEGLFSTEVSYILRQHLRGAVPDLAWWSQMHRREKLLSWLSFHLTLTQAGWLWGHVLVSSYCCDTLWEQWVRMPVPLAEIISVLIYGLHLVYKAMATDIM